MPLFVVGNCGLGSIPGTEITIGIKHVRKIDTNKSLSDKLTQFETEKAQATRSQQILAKAKEYGIPENYAKRCAIKDDEDLDAYFKDLKQEFANDGFKGVTPPESAEAKIEKESESIAKMIDEGTKTIVEQNKN